MNKKELVKSVAAATGMTARQTAQAVEAMIGTLVDTLEHGNGVTIQGFGSFSLKQRMARRGINPSTRQEMIIPAKKDIRFRSSIVVKA